ncbi:hypothetical protein H6763_02710 [Candidatus Nomurabacteria bacterium]|nr:hypothetical protein [Candidatus Nomurabacteria bacterium]MCB9803716.1 hypothetical protein [Candidatus Nomurabacteria bacterium]
MYKLAGRRKLGRKVSHRRSLIKNQVRSILTYGKVTTTTPKAKVLKANVESYLNDLNSKAEKVRKYELLTLLGDDSSANKMVEYLKSSPKVKIVKVGFRDGDNAEVSRVSLQGFSSKVKKDIKTQKSVVQKTPLKQDTKDKKPPVQDEDAVELREAKEERESDKAKSLAKNLKNRFVGKERARSRSGI